MAPVMIRAARWKSAMFLIVCVVFVAIGVVMVIYPDGPQVSLDGWLSIAIFGAGGAAATWLIIRPQTMRLDAEGLTLDGGFLRRPRRVMWRDVEIFTVLRLPRGGRLVGYRRRADLLVTTPASQLSRFFGADGALPGGWSRSAEKIAILLNDYRAQALTGSP
jgi:hypothetical protein